VAARIYIDCVLDSELESSDVGLKDFRYSVVGRGATTSRWYEGEIDELRVWNRALAEEEITMLCDPPPPS
jgi:hypothetical protein